MKAGGFARTERGCGLRDHHGSEGEAGRRRGFAVVMQHVTDRRKAAIELESVRQERMTLQEQFLSHVSHELRTPLTAIYFFITNLLEGVNERFIPGTTRDFGIQPGKYQSAQGHGERFSRH